MFNDISYYNLIGYITASTGIPEFKCTLHPRKQYLLFPMDKKIGIYRKKSFWGIVKHFLKKLFGFTGFARFNKGLYFFRKNSVWKLG